MSALNEFLQKAEDDGTTRTVRSYNPFAGIRFAQQKLNPEWKGDRGPLKEAPPWGRGIYANGLGVNPPTTEREGNRESRDLVPVGDAIFGRNGEDYEVDGVHALMLDALKRYRGGQPMGLILRYVQARKEKLLANDEKSQAEQEYNEKQNINKSDLTRLWAAAAGWGLSDDVVRSGGGTPRGGPSDAEIREWERALERQERDEERRQRQIDERRSGADRRRHERSMRSAMRRTRKSLDDYPQFTRMTKFFSEGSDEYHRRTPLMLAKSEDISLQKEHMPAPPRQGLVWDPVKHRWVRAENAGKAVGEAKSGKGGRRFRGAGVGAHERSVSGHGKGPVRFAQSGRRFRGPQLPSGWTKKGLPTASARQKLPQWR